MLDIFVYITISERKHPCLTSLHISVYAKIHVSHLRNTPNIFASLPHIVVYVADQSLFQIGHDLFIRE
jgi:hypothetical protein